MRKLLFYSGIYGVSVAALKGFNFLFVLWIAKKLPQDEFGRFGLFYALQTGLVTFAIAGIFEAVIGLMRDYKRDVEKNTLYSAASTNFLLLSLAVASFVIIVNWLYTEESLFIIISVVVIAGVLLAFSNFQSQLFRLNENYQLSVAWNFFPTLAVLFGGIIAFYYHRSLFALFSGSAVGAAIAISIFYLAGLGHFKFSLDYGLIKKIAKRIFPFFAVAFFGWLSGYGNNYLIKMIFQSTEVAMFTFVLSISSIMQLVVTSVNQVWAPQFFKLVNSSAIVEAEKQNRRFSTLTAVGLGVFAAFVLTFFSFAIDKIGGNLLSYKQMNLELFCLMAGYLALIPWYQSYNYFLVYDKGQSVLKVVLISSIIGIVVWLIFMLTMGSFGIYFGFLVQMVFRSAVIWVAVKRNWDVRFAWSGILFGFLIMLGGLYVSYLLN